MAGFARNVVKNIRRLAVFGSLDDVTTHSCLCLTERGHHHHCVLLLWPVRAHLLRHVLRMLTLRKSGFPTRSAYALMIWYDMIWYDMIWYMIWYNMIYVIIRYMLYDIWYMLWYDIWYMLWYDIDICYDVMMWYDMIYVMIWYDIFVNRNWVDTRWQ